MFLNRVFLITLVVAWQLAISKKVFAGEDFLLLAPLSSSGSSSGASSPAQSSSSHQNSSARQAAPRVSESSLRHRQASLNTAQAITAFQTQPQEKQNIVLNLFPNAWFKAKVKSVRSTQFGGSFVSAELNGENSGLMTLNIGKNGSIRGEVHSSRGVYTIRNQGLSNSETQTVLIQEIDMSKMPRGNDMISLPIENLDQISKKKSFLETANQESSALITPDASEDEDTIDVLVLYTAKAREAEGTTQDMLDTIRSEISKANQALSDSGLTRGREIRLVHSEEASYSQNASDMTIDLQLLTLKRGQSAGRFTDTNGILDQAHTLRDQYAADLVHLFVKNAPNFCGIAYTYSQTSESSSNTIYNYLERNDHDWSDITTDSFDLMEFWKDDLSFSVSALACKEGYAFSHEIGHNMGLHHDRYTSYHDNPPETPNFPIYPYGYGYVNQNFTHSRCLRTIMAYDNQCTSEGFTNEQLGLTTGFSNPDRNFSTGDPAGHSGDDFTTILTGPANAAQAINHSWPNLAKLMPSENSCSNNLSLLKDGEEVISTGSSSTEPIIVSPSGETFSLNIHPSFCDSRFTLHSFHPFIPRDRLSQSGRTISVTVNSNGSCSEREGSISAEGWGNNFRVLIRQGVSARSLIKKEIAGQCSSASDSQLSSATELNLKGKSITDLHREDLSGLTSLEVLSLENNQLSALSNQMFSALSSLEKLNLSKNRILTVSSSAFSGLSSLTLLDLDRNSLLILPNNVFSGLSNLKYLWLSQNNLGSLSSGIFSDLSRLRALGLDHNNLRNLPTGVFSGLSHLRYLWLNSNDLTNLPSSIASLSRLRYLNLSNNNFSSLSSSVCNFLQNVSYIVLDTELSRLCSSSSSSSSLARNTASIGVMNGKAPNSNSVGRGASINNQANELLSSVGISPSLFQSHFVFVENNTYHYIKKDIASSLIFGNPDSVLKAQTKTSMGQSSEALSREGYLPLSDFSLSKNLSPSQTLYETQRRIIRKMKEDGLPLEAVSYLADQPLSAAE